MHAFLQAGYGAERRSALPAAATGLDDALLLWGGLELQPLGMFLPAWLSSRLSLPFAPIKSEGMRPPPCERADLDLFWSAVTYVEKLS
jgi:hypothetical protein